MKLFIFISIEFFARFVANMIGSLRRGIFSASKLPVNMASKRLMSNDSKKEMVRMLFLIRYNKSVLRDLQSEVTLILLIKNAH